MKKRIGIIGGSGSIGSQIVKYYGRKNVTVYSSKKNNYKSFDLTKKIGTDYLLKIFKNIDIIIFCSSLIKDEKDQKLYHFNYILFSKFLKFLQNTRIKLVYLSTASVYPKNTKLVCRENKRITKKNMTGGYYAYTKYLAEKEIKKKIKKNNYLILRLGAIYGLKKNNNFLDRCLNKLKNKKKFYFTKTMQTKFNFIHVRQIAHCIDYLIKKNKYGLYNIGNFNFITIEGIINNLKKIYKNSDVGILKKKKNYKPMRYFINFSLAKLKKTKYNSYRPKEFIC